MKFSIHSRPEGILFFTRLKTVMISLVLGVFAVVVLPLFADEGPVASTPGHILIKAVGDMVPGTNFPDASRLPRNGASSLFKEVSSHLAGADLLFGNFESTFTNYPKTRKDTSRRMVFAFRSPPEYAHDFRRAGFDILSIANNHSNDFFQAGFDDTARSIEAAGMAHTGLKNEITYLNRNGIVTAFIGFSYLAYHNSIHKLDEASALVRKAADNADVVVVSVHAGAEGNKALHVYDKDEHFYSENRGNLVRFSHTMIDNGADLILGHGPHVPRAMELYKGRLIAYSLGNFMGYKVFAIRQYTGYSLILEARMNKTGEFVSGRVVPVRLTSSGVPYYDEKGASISLIRELSKKDFPASPLVIDSSGSLQIAR